MIEASSKLPAEALQAALTDVKQKFNISRKTLLTLDDAGVPESVIDLMVALTFPDRFIVERAAGGSAPVGVSTGMGWYDPFDVAALGRLLCELLHGERLLRLSQLLQPVRTVLLRLQLYVTARYYPYYNYGGGWYRSTAAAMAAARPRRSGAGRAINGRGYTQIRERSPEPTVSRTNNGGNGTASGWSGNSGGATSERLFERLVVGRIVRRLVVGGGDSGRTAVARPPGGGN